MRWTLALVLVLVLVQSEAKDKVRKRGKKRQDEDIKPKEKRHKPLKLRLVPAPRVLIGPEPLQSDSIGPFSQDMATSGPEPEDRIPELLKTETDSQDYVEPEFSDQSFTNDVVEKWEQQQKKKEESRRRNKRRRDKQKKREEQQALRIQVKNEQKKWKQLEAEIRRQEETKLRRQEEAELRKGEEEVQVWLRGDVFEIQNKDEKMESQGPTDERPAEGDMDAITVHKELQEVFDPSPDPDLDPGRGGLPQGCDISDVTVSCENANLLHFPPLSIPELKSLSLEGNNISSVPAGAFNGIPNLEWINLKKNRLTSAGIHPLAFTRLKFLTRLYLDGNLLEVVPSGFPQTLQELKINENHLQGIQESSFKGLNSLVTLELEGNRLSEGGVAHGAFRDLKELFYLRLGRNLFRAVPQGLPPSLQVRQSLQELYLEHNLIEEISDTIFNQTQSLTLISLRNNRLEENRIGPHAWIHHRSLESLDLSHNELHLVPSFLPQALVHLVLVGNHIERIPGYVFAHMSPGLEYLYLSYNKLDGEGVEPESFLGTYQSMVELCLDHNNLLNVPSGINEMINLHFLRLNDNKIRTVPDHSLCDPGLNGEGSLVAVRLDNNFINPETVSPSAFSCVRASSSVVLKPQYTAKRSLRHK
uniref:Extracellular matrix protein 2 n=1 Tax=Knipowitschia caucasica TaxID=637954 RepID=A0AAV2MIV3_KNICA